MSGPGHSAPFEHLCPIIATVTSLRYQASNDVTLQLKLVRWEMEDVFFPPPHMTRQWARLTSSFPLLIEGACGLNTLLWFQLSNKMLL